MAQHSRYQRRDRWGRTSGARATKHRLRLVPVAEGLEKRQLLAADPSVFAQYTMSPQAPGTPAAVTIHVGRSEFTFRHHKVLLGMEMVAPAGSLSPITMNMTPVGAANGQIVFQNNEPSGGNRDDMMAMVGPGNYVVQVVMPDVTAPLQLDLSLVGDVNGDHRVNGADIKLIRSALGQSVGQAGAPLAADPDGHPKIDNEDLRLARENLGVALTDPPLFLSAGLDPSSNPDGNGMVTAPNVTISGQTVPGATVKLGQGDSGTFTQTSTADSQGNYQFQVNVDFGVTPFHVEADSGGRSVTADTKITRGDVIIAWNATMLEAARVTKDSLGLFTRTMAMVQAAIYDAVNDIDRLGSVYHVNVNAPAGSSPGAAAAEAAYDVLMSLIPQEKALYDATLAETLADIPDGAAKTDGIAVGDQVAAGILAWRANDGSNVQVPYVPGTAPGQWRPTPPDYSVAWGPEWGQVMPFAVPSANAFLPPPPPALDSAAYAKSVKMTESLGALRSTTRTADETQIGVFWAYDTSGMGPPPIMFNQVLQTIALQQHNTLDQDARLFALADVAMADAGIVAWDAKYTYDRWRPITAIRDANHDGNPATTADPGWTPFGSPGDGMRANFTPNFPAYPSGHATFGGALFTILADFYGTNQMHFTLYSDELPGVARSYSSFSDAAAELDWSRIYLGIHYIDDEVNGNSTGDKIGNYVFQNTMTLSR